MAPLQTTILRARNPLGYETVRSHAIVTRTNSSDPGRKMGRRVPRCAHVRAADRVHFVAKRYAATWHHGEVRVGMSRPNRGKRLSLKGDDTTCQRLGAVQMCENLAEQM